MYHSNPDRERDRSRKYFKNNRDKVLKNKREQYIQNSESEIARSRKYKDEHEEDTKRYRSEYYRKNKSKLIADEIRRAKTKREIDPAFRLRDNLSKHINCALKRHGSSKMGESTFTHLEYTIDDLRRHLESQFEVWMSWENYGKYEVEIWDDSNPNTWRWNIDHIVPQSKFSFSSMQSADFKKCWALDNLRPLSAKENLQKGNR